MKNKMLVATLVAFCALCASKVNASEPTPCEAAAKICEVPVYEPTPCAPVETSFEIPEPCAPAVAIPTCGETVSDDQGVFCRSRKTVRKKIVNKKKRCFLSSLKERCNESTVARKTGIASKEFSFSFHRETEVQVSN